MKQKWLTEIVPDSRKSSSDWRLWMTAILILLSPWLMGSLGVGMVMGGMYCSVKALGVGNWGWARRCSQVSGGLGQIIGPLSPLAFGYPVDELLSVAVVWADVVKQADQVVELLSPYVLALTHPSASPPTADVGELSRAVSQLSEHLAYLQSQQLKIIEGPVTTGRGLVTKLSLLVGELPQLLSLTKSSQWLVLLQDDTELRPTGGFIDGIGLVTVEGGHFKQIQWLSTAAVDAQLKGQVTPPAELTEVLGESNWYLRDSNWDPDFPASASRSAWFVQRELGQGVDMVVAVDLSILGEMLKVVGSVDLPQFGGQMDSTSWQANYLGTVKLDAEEHFAPLLAEALWTKAALLSANQQRQLLQLVVAGLETDQIQLWSTWNSSAVAMAGWDGRLGVADCASPFSCVNDFVYPVDTNIGVNKVNAQVSRSAQVQVRISASTVTTTYRQTWSNLSMDSGWPLGEYRNYLRLYLPATAQLEKIKWGDETLALASVVQTGDRGMQKMGLTIAVPVGESRQLEVTWRQSVPAAPRWHYQLVMPHQSGVRAYPAVMVVDYPKDWWSQAGPAPSVVSSGQIQYNLAVDRTRMVNIDWVPSQ